VNSRDKNVDSGTPTAGQQLGRELRAQQQNVPNVTKDRELYHLKDLAKL
jgi:hypothetical protein